MDLSRLVQTFGFELEPNQFQTFVYTAEFYNGATLVESISREVDGASGARLFARTGEPINQVVVTGQDSFAIAQVRYQLATQPVDPSAQAFVILVVLVLLLLLLLVLLG